MPKDNIPPNLRVAVGQDGARLHYAIAIALKRVGMLRALYTNWYNDGSLTAKAIIAAARLVAPGLAQKMTERQSPDLAGVPVYDAKFIGLLLGLFHDKAGLARLVFRLARLCHRRKVLWFTPLGRGTREVDAYFVFSHAIAPAMAQACRHRGIKVILDQPIAPATEIIRQLQINLDRWPGWAVEESDRIWRLQKSHEAAIFSLADCFTCASDYVRDGLLAQGVAADKISVIPYPFDVQHYPAVNRAGRSGPVRVGFVGQVGLRKGAPWFLETAKLCDPDLVKFTMVGPAALTDFGRKQMEQHVELAGSVPRSQILDWLKRFDIFFFPSTCEGSAGAVMEAMATGLPIITTHNSGTVIRHGVEGYIAPYDNPEVMAAYVTELASNTEKRHAMGEISRQRALEFSIEFYSTQLAAALKQMVWPAAG